MKCVVCGKEIEESLYSNKILCSSKCFIIDDWSHQVEIKDDSNIVRIEGEQFRIGNANGNGGMRGHSGRKFRIRKFNGDIVETTNLWHNGKIPEQFKSLLPDNAKFICEQEEFINEY